MILMKRLDNESSRTINYSADIAQLEKYYQEQYTLIKSGNTDLATLDLVMLGNALDFIRFVRKTFDIKLCNDENSVSKLEEVLDALNRGFLQENFLDESNGNIAKKAGAYLGFLIISNIGGKWIDTENGAAVDVNGRKAYVCDFVLSRLQSGTELNTLNYYKSIRTVK